MDAYALFGLAHRPLIGSEALKEKYLQLAADCHPDASGGDSESFHQVQEAYQTLREPAARLRHLIELEFPGYRSGTGGAPQAELFLQAGSAFQAARIVSQRLENARSALARALLSPELGEALRLVREAFEAVQRADVDLAAQLANLDARWPNVSPDELSGLASAFKFLRRWKSQLSEWEFRLANS